MRILGINEAINSSVCVLEDGRIVFALQEERVCREKNYIGFPERALAFTLEHLGRKPADFDAVCLSNEYSPTFTKESFYAAYEAAAERRPNVTLHGIKDFLLGSQRLLPEGILTGAKSAMGRKSSGWVVEKLESMGFAKDRIVRAEHHRLHAASAYYGMRANANEPHLVLTLDGSGDGSCAQVYIGENGSLRRISNTPMGHSIGNVYSLVTHYLGMVPHEHEYKLMGLSAYRERDRHVLPLMKKLQAYVDLDPADPLMFKCGVPEPTYLLEPRIAEDFKRVRFDNMAAALQFYTEDLLLRWVEAAVRKTGIRKVVCAGGVFMNVKANKRISELPEVEFFDVFPSCGDETLCFGGVWNEYAQKSPTRGNDIVFDSFCLGPDAGFDLAAARQRFADRVVFREVEDPEKEIAALLMNGEIVARCSGPMEFGARALGNRSIIADPSKLGIIPKINKMIKQRDFWMPFAPAVLREFAEQYLTIPHGLPKNRINPFMMHTFDTTAKRGDLMAGVHAYDHTARAQVVDSATYPKLHRLISLFAETSGRGAILNTSFNLHGYPIVMGACDAIEVLLNSSLDWLVVNDTVIQKKASS